MNIPSGMPRLKGFRYPREVIAYAVRTYHRFVPGELVELECVEALHLHEGEPRGTETEWLGTRAIWNISRTENSAVVRFEHVRLAPNLHSNEVCEAGWDRFVVESLKAYLDTVRGIPHRALDLSPAS